MKMKDNVTTKADPGFPIYNYSQSVADPGFSRGGGREPSRGA